MFFLGLHSFEFTGLALYCFFLLLSHSIFPSLPPPFSLLWSLFIDIFSGTPEYSQLSSKTPH